MKNRNYRAKSRLICCKGRNFHLQKRVGDKWISNGGEKSMNQLYPLIDGSRYDFFLLLETKEALLKNSVSKKFSRLIKKLSVVD